MATLDISKTNLAEMFRDEGRLEEKRDVVLRMGKKKFGIAAPPDVRIVLKSIADVDRLNELIDRVLDVNTWQELLAP